MSVITYKCPNCDGGLSFDPETQKFKCEYCLSDFSETELDRVQQDVSSNELLLYTCPSCGAKIVADETTAATYCYYCHNPVVLSGKLEDRFKPDYVIPFTIDKEEAKKIFRDWIKRKRFVPKNFFSDDQIEKLSGIYFPYWIYSCQVDGSLQAEASNVRVWRAGDIQYTETKKYNVEREGKMEVKNIIRNALKKANKKLVEGVLPFQMEKVREFNMGYLSGFQAERWDIESDQFDIEVKQEVRDFATQSLKNSVSGYTSVSVKRISGNILSEKWRYALMPVWVLTYRDDKADQIYYFALNGQTGKTCGGLPFDKLRLFGLFAVVFFPVLFILLLGGYLI